MPCGPSRYSLPRRVGAHVPIGLKVTSDLNRNAQKSFLTRLDRVWTIANQPGYGVGDDMDVLLSEFDSSFQSDGGLWK